mmetsp:Transcript_70109/g.194971  ORF Transcript_70109/g.194971 Transcript_70109/m.194971 type:complete len:249 (+) Transcript_70109:454-1200(+)
MEDAREEAMLPEHAGAADDDQRDATLGADCRDAAIPLVGFRKLADDPGAWMKGLFGIPHAYGDLLLPSGQHRRGMHHLRAEGRQLGRLLVRKDGDRPCRRNDPRICSQNAADVFPDLHLACFHRRSNDGGGKVRAIAPEGGDRTLHILRDVPGHDGNIRIVPRQGLKEKGDVLVGLLQDLNFRECRLRTARATARDHANLPAVVRLGEYLFPTLRFGALVEIGAENPDAEALAVGDNEVARSSRQLLQ